MTSRKSFCMIFLALLSIARSLPAQPKQSPEPKAPAQTAKTQTPRLATQIFVPSLYTLARAPMAFSVLLRSGGQIISGANLVFRINQTVEATSTSDATGHATFNLPGGIAQSVWRGGTISFGGSASYAASQSTGFLTVVQPLPPKPPIPIPIPLPLPAPGQGSVHTDNKPTSKTILAVYDAACIGIFSQVTLKCVLTDAQGKPIVGKTVTLTLHNNAGAARNGVSYATVTDASGMAQVVNVPVFSQDLLAYTENAPYSALALDITAHFDGDGLHPAADGTAKLTINK